MNEFFNKDRYKKKRKRKREEKGKKNEGEKERGRIVNLTGNLFSNKDTTVASKWNSFKGRAPLRRYDPPLSA